MSRTTWDRLLVVWIVAICGGSSVIYLPWGPSSFVLPKMLWIEALIGVGVAVVAISFGRAAPRFAQWRSVLKRLPSWILSWPLLCLWAAATLPLSVSPWLGVIPLLNMTLYLGYFVILLYVLRSSRRSGLKRTVLAALSLFAVLQGAYGIIQFVGWDPLLEPVAERVRGRSLAAGTLGKPLALGEYLAISIPVIAGLFVTEKVWWRSWIWLSATMLACAGLLASGARSALLALVGAAVLVGALSIGRNRGENLSARVTTQRRRLWLVLALGVCMAVGVFVSSDHLRSNLSDLIDPSRGSVRLRLTWWSAIPPLVAEHPVAGTGLGTFPMAYYDQVTARDLGQHGRGGARLLERAHNDPAQLAVELGLVGLLLGLVFAVGLVLAVFHEGGRRRERGQASELQPYLGTALLTGLGSSLAGFPFHSPAVAVTYVTILGIYLGCAATAFIRPKYLESRSAMLGVTPRFPLTSSLTR